VSSEDAVANEKVPLRTIAGQWGRLGCIGFGGPPAHITLLRRLCVTDHAWMDDQEFEDAIATTSLLPGPASTQLAIYCAWRLRGALGALVGGIVFIAPGLVLIIALAAVFLEHNPPLWILGASAGAGAGVPAVALHAATQLLPQSRQRIGTARSALLRWTIYGVVGVTVAATVGQFVVLALLGCGLVEVMIRSPHGRPQHAGLIPLAMAKGVALGGVGALAWVSLKIGALSYGGGFVIIPLMQHDVVTTYHWMTASQFLNAIALGQITPGPLVQTIAVVGYAAGGVGFALLAAALAFGPSFLFVIVGAPRYAALRVNRSVTSFLRGAGPCVIGAIAGSAIVLGRSLSQPWQFILLGVALLWFFALKKGVVPLLLLCGAVGIVLAFAGVTL